MPTVGTAAASDRTDSPGGVGPLLRAWRERRRLSQLQLAAMAEVSTRHLSYVETGRSSPSRELIQHLARHLEIPHRVRNDLLLAAGYAPAHLELDLDDPAMADVRLALDAILTGNGGHPTLVMDRRWNLVDANDAALAWTAHVAPHLLAPPLNVVRTTLHPDGLSGLIDNLDEVRHHLLDRLRRQLARTPDPELETLLEEVAEWGPVGTRRDRPERIAHHVTEPAMPVVMTIDGTTTRYLSVVSTFGSPLDVTAAELTIEAFYAVG